MLHLTIGTPVKCGVNRMLLPRDRSRAMQHHISQQVLEARLVKAGRSLVALKQAKQAKQAKLYSYGWHRLASV